MEADDTPTPRESVAPSDMVARVRGLARSSPPIALPTDAAPSVETLVAALEAEKEARSRDATMLGEMFVRACDADAKRRTAETAAEALAQRLATVESELLELRARGGANEAAVAREGEARARALEVRLHSESDKLRRTEEALRSAEERARSADQTCSVMEQAARASKDELASLAVRVDSLEAELGSARSTTADEQDRAAALARRVDELSAAASRVSELETFKARATELETRLVQIKDEHARTTMRVTVAETRAEELVQQVNDHDQRASRAEWEVEKLTSDLEAARRRSSGIETELARVMKRANDLERDLGVMRAEIETGESQLRARTDGNHAARVLIAELEAEEQRASDRRRKALAEAREVLSRGDGPVQRSGPPAVRIEAAKPVRSSPPAEKK